MAGDDTWPSFEGWMPGYLWLYEGDDVHNITSVVVEVYDVAD